MKDDICFRIIEFVSVMALDVQSSCDIEFVLLQTQLFGVATPFYV